MAADATYAPGFQRRQDGNAAVSSGYSLDIESGASLKIAGTSITTAVTTAVAGVAAGYKIARGEATLDGSNPTTAATGLTTIVSATATLKSTAAPGDDPSWVSINYTGSDGNLDIYAWKNTGGTDPTLVASTNNSAVFSWIAIGT